MKVWHFFLFALAWFTVFQVGFRRSVFDSIALGFSSASIVVFVVVLVKF